MQSTEKEEERKETREEKPAGHLRDDTKNFLFHCLTTPEKNTHLWWSLQICLLLLFTTVFVTFLFDYFSKRVEDEEDKENINISIRSGFVCTCMYACKLCEFDKDTALDLSGVRSR